MHELSIAQSLVEIASEQLRSSGHADDRVAVIRLRIGALSCIHKDSLFFSYDLITADTPLVGSKLEIEEVPVRIFCEHCQCEQTLPGIQSFRCPVCTTPSSDIRAGRELDIESLTLVSLHGSAI